MNATACYFENWMEHENAEIARGLRRRDPDLLDHLIEQGFGFSGILILRRSRWRRRILGGGRLGDRSVDRPEK